jgi:hypothetical protein
MKYFLLDAREEMQKHMQQLRGNSATDAIHGNLDGGKLDALYEMLQENNPYARDLQMIGLGLDAPIGARDPVVAEHTIHADFITEKLDVASVTNDAMTGNRVIRFREKGKAPWHELNAVNEKVDALCFPLLFPFGENGWSPKIRKSFGYPDVLASRLLKPENDLEEFQNKDGINIPVNRFQVMPRLMQYYIVDGVSRSIDHRLKWHKDNQDKFFGVPRPGDVETENDGGIDMDAEVGDDQSDNEVDRDDNEARQREIDDHEDDERELTGIVPDDNDHEIAAEIEPLVMGARVEQERRHKIDTSPCYLGASHHGSRRHLRRKATDALTIITERGRPRFELNQNKILGNVFNFKLHFTQPLCNAHMQCAMA